MNKPPEGTPPPSSPEERRQEIKAGMFVKLNLQPGMDPISEADWKRIHPVTAPTNGFLV